MQKHPKPKRPKKPQYEDFDQLLKKQDSKHAWNGLIVYATDAEGEVLVNRGGNIPHNPASLNKLMIFHLVMDAVEAGKLDLNQEIAIPRIYITDGISRLESDPSKLKKKPSNLMPTWLMPGSTFTLKNLLGTLMIASDNGAAKLLGDKLEEIYYQPIPGKDHKSHIDWDNPLIRDARVMPQDQMPSAHKGTIPQALDAPVMPPEIMEKLSRGVSTRSTKSAVNQMNEKARKLGMHHTTYANENGLPTNWKGEKTNPENSTTAQDLALILKSIDAQHQRLTTDDKKPEQGKEVTALFSYLQSSSITYGKELGGKDHVEPAHQKLVVKGATSYLGDKYDIFAKTGYIAVSGHNIGTSVKDKTSGHKVHVVVMGGTYADRSELKDMHIGITTIKKNDSVKGSAVRDAIVKKLAPQLLEKEQQIEKAQEKTAPKSGKEKVGYVSPDLQDIPWKPEPSPSTPIQFDGEFSEPKSSVAKQPAQRNKPGYGVA